MVCPYDLSVPGGVQAQVTGLAEALQAIGASVTVVAPSSAQKASRTATNASAGYRFVGIGKSINVTANGSKAPVAPGPLPMARTLGALADMRADVVHVHEPLVPGSSLAALLAGPRPIVATFHRGGSDLAYRIEGRLLAPLAARIDVAVAVSDAARATAVQVLGRRLHEVVLIPNGVDLRYFTGPETSRAVRPASNDRDSPLKILFVGRHEPRKGLLVLLRAFDLFSNTRAEVGSPHVRLVVVGEGPDTKQLRDRFSPNESIDWLGRVDDDEKARLLRCADVLVAPSLGGESFGVVLLEAMAAGAPVIASDIPGYRLAAGEAARFVPSGDVAALANALCRVLGDAPERERLATLAQARVLDYRMDIIAGRYMATYAGLLAARP